MINYNGTRFFIALCLLLLSTSLQATIVTVEGKHPRSDGSFHAFQVVDGDVLSPGDRFQIVIDADRQTYYSIVYVSREGDAVQIFPPAGKQGRIAAGQKQFIPDRQNYFTLDNNGGRELMYVVTGNNPLGNLNSVLKRVGEMSNSPAAIQAYLDKRLPTVNKLEVMNTGKRITGLTDQVASGLVRDLSQTYAANPWSASAVEEDTQVRKRRAGDSSIPEEVRRRAREVRSLLRRPRGTSGSSSLRTVQSRPDKSTSAAESKAAEEYRIESRTRPSTSMDLSTVAEDKVGIAKARQEQEELEQARRGQEQQRLAELERASLERQRAEQEAQRLQQEREQAKRLEAESIAQARAAEERVRQQREAAARAAEDARIKAEQQDAQRRAELVRLQAEEERQERLRAEAEAKRLKQERLEAERLAQAQRDAERAAKEARRIEEARAEAERQRIARERAERERAEALEREAERLEQTRQQGQRQQLELERIAAEKAAAEARAQRLVEQKEEAERLRLAQEEAQRLEAEARRLEAQRLTREKEEAEARRIEAERIAVEKAAEAERLAEEKRLVEQRAREEEIRRQEERRALKAAEEEAARLQAELAAAETARSEKERAEAEARHLAEQRAAEEASRLKAEKQARLKAEGEAQRLELERLALEEKLKAEQEATEKEAAERATAEQRAQAEQKQLASSKQQEIKAEESEPGLLGNVLSFLKPAEGNGLDSTGAPISKDKTADAPLADNTKSEGPREAVVALQAPSQEKPRKNSASAPKRPQVAAPVVGEELRSLYAQIASAIVSIRTSNTDHAAGFILNASGHVLTGWHVVDEATDISVEFMAVSGVPRSYQARVIKQDKFRDLALLELVDAPAGIQPINLLQGGLPDAGTTVRVFGHRDGQVWATDEAVITRIAENFTWFSTNNVIHRGEVLQVDLPASGKNIGSLVTDMNYQMLGVKSFSGRETGRTYAVSVRTIRDFLSAGE